MCSHAGDSLAESLIGLPNMAGNIKNMLDKRCHFPTLRSLLPQPALCPTVLKDLSGRRFHDLCRLGFSISCKVLEVSLIESCMVTLLATDLSLNRIKIQMLFHGSGLHLGNGSYLVFPYLVSHSGTEGLGLPVAIPIYSSMIQSLWPPHYGHQKYITSHSGCEWGPLR